MEQEAAPGEDALKVELGLAASTHCVELVHSRPPHSASLHRTRRGVSQLVTKLLTSLSLRSSELIFVVCKVSDDEEIQPGKVPFSASYTTFSRPSTSCPSVTRYFVA